LKKFDRDGVRPMSTTNAAEKFIVVRAVQRRRYTETNSRGSDAKTLGIVRLGCPRCGSRPFQSRAMKDKDKGVMKSEPWLASVLDFTRAMFGDWLARMSGPASVPAAAFAFWVSNDTAKILLGLTAFVCLWLTAYRLWKSEHDKVVQREQRKHQLLGEIAERRETLVQYRIDMEADHNSRRFDEAIWTQRYKAIEAEIAARIEELAGSAEASTFRKRGNIHRSPNPTVGGFLWPVLVDVCRYDLDYLKDFIHEYARGERRTS
jgi:hypothetical protein